MFTCEKLYVAQLVANENLFAKNYFCHQVILFHILQIRSKYPSLCTHFRYSYSLFSFGHQLKRTAFEKALTYDVFTVQYFNAK